MAARLDYKARKYGREAGRASASWATDGNTTDETYRRVLAGIEDGDPEILDMFNAPNLSGEWADSPTPATLADELGISADDERLDDLCTEWETAASDAFWARLEADCRTALGEC